MVRLLVCFCLIVLAVSTVSAESLPWDSRSYSSRPLPAEWVIVGSPSKPSRELEEFINWRFNDTDVRSLIRNCGPPDRFMVPMNPKADSFLVYDLPGGEVAAFCVNPPHHTFKAGVVYDSKGKLLTLIK